MTDAARDTFDALADRPYADVLIVGGGINGLATFRDLALQGVDVALVEREDFVSGASAASSHMIHGGIRYLENGEFRLVHEAVTERNALLRIAPHFVRPLQTTIPIFSTFSGVLSAPLRFLRHGGGGHTERGAALIKIGLVIYDSFSRGGAFSGQDRVPRHTFRGRKRSLQDLPELNPGVKYTATYWDASLHDPERLAIDVLQDARSAGGDRARAANYTAAVGAESGRVLLRDARVGREVAFAASVVINASGPWTDHTNAALDNATRHMGGTKGSHIVLDNPELLAATGGRELFFENADGRIVLIYPLKGRVLVGTTDIEHAMGEPTVCTEAEVDYFIDLIGQVLPRIEVDRAQIVYRFSGVRPLPGHGDVAPGFVSRDYRIESAVLPESETTVLSLVGGKWTTFRASAENLADHALELLAVPRRTSTRGVPIGGGRGYPTTERARRQWIDSHAQGTRPGTGRRAARPLRHRRRRGHRRDRGRPRRRAAGDDSVVQHGRAAPPRPHRIGRAPRRRAAAAHEPRVHRRRHGGIRAGDRRRDRSGDGLGRRAPRDRGGSGAGQGARRRSDLDAHGTGRQLGVALI